MTLGLEQHCSLLMAARNALLETNLTTDLLLLVTFSFTFSWIYVKIYLAYSYNNVKTLKNNVIITGTGQLSNNKNGKVVF